MSSYKTSIYQTSSYRTSRLQTPSLPNVHFTRRPGYQTSSLQNVQVCWGRLGWVGTYLNRPNLSPVLYPPYPHSYLYHCMEESLQVCTNLTYPTVGNNSPYPLTYPPVYDKKALSNKSGRKKPNFK
jgi:hypothetical protein